jgi:hypothetical protein
MFQHLTFIRILATTPTGTKYPRHGDVPTATSINQAHSSAAHEHRILGTYPKHDLFKAYCIHLGCTTHQHMCLDTQPLKTHNVCCTLLGDQSRTRAISGSPYTQRRNMTRSIPNTSQHTCPEHGQVVLELASLALTMRNVLASLPTAICMLT